MFQFKGQELNPKTKTYVPVISEFVESHISAIHLVKNVEAIQEVINIPTLEQFNNDEVAYKQRLPQFEKAREDAIKNNELRGDEHILQIVYGAASVNYYYESKEKAEAAKTEFVTIYDNAMLKYYMTKGYLTTNGFLDAISQRFENLIPQETKALFAELLSKIVASVESKMGEIEEALNAEIKTEPKAEETVND